MFNPDRHPRPECIPPSSGHVGQRSFFYDGLSYMIGKIMILTCQPSCKGGWMNLGVDTKLQSLKNPRATPSVQLQLHLQQFAK